MGYHTQESERPDFVLFVLKIKSGHWKGLFSAVVYSIDTYACISWEVGLSCRSHYVGVLLQFADEDIITPVILYWK